MKWSLQLDRADLEGLALGGAHNISGADALDASLASFYTSANLNLELLDVGGEGALGNAANFHAVTTQVLGLTALGVMVAGGRLLAEVIALGRHDSIHLCQKSFA